MVAPYDVNDASQKIQYKSDITEKVKVQMFTIVNKYLVLTFQCHGSIVCFSFSTHDRSLREPPPT